MSKKRCHAQLDRVIEMVIEMKEILDGDDGIQAFIEAYSETAEILLEAHTMAVRSALNIR